MSLLMRLTLDARRPVQIVKKRMNSMNVMGVASFLLDLRAWVGYYNCEKNRALSEKKAKRLQLLPRNA